MKCFPKPLMLSFDSDEESWAWGWLNWVDLFNDLTQIVLIKRSEPIPRKVPSGVIQ